MEQKQCPGCGEKVSFELLESGSHRCPECSHEITELPAQKDKLPPIPSATGAALPPIPPSSTRDTPPPIPPQSTGATPPPIPPSSTRDTPPPIPPSSTSGTPPPIPPQSTGATPPPAPEAKQDFFSSVYSEPLVWQDFFTQKTYHMGTIILGISAVLFLLMIVGLSTSTENRGERSYARESRSSSRSMPTPSLRVQAPQLWDDYSSNRIAAEQRYEGKTIAVSGSVSKVMGSGRSVTVFLTGRDALIGGGIIGCDLAASESSKAATLGDGDYIEIVGTCKGHSYFGFVEGVQITKGIISDGSSSTTSVSASAPSVISARDVVAAFRENEVAAGQRFLHQKFTVTGDVVKADRNMWGTIEVILSADDQFADVYCYFGKSDASAVAKLRQGERVSIRGTCTSFDTVFVGVGQLVFKNCTIL